MTTRNTGETAERLDLPKRGKKIASLLAIKDENGKVVGRLDIRNKSVVFRGKCDLAARAFFQASKKFIEEYIKESLSPVPSPEEVAKDDSKLGRAIRHLGLKKCDILMNRMREGRLVIVTKAGRKYKI